MSMEGLVRPFQRMDVFNARVAPPVQPARPEPQDPVSITITGSNAGLYVEEPPPYVNNIDVTWEEDASRRRVSETVVTNPDDESQSVTVERIDEATFINNKTREELNLKMNW